MSENMIEEKIINLPIFSITPDADQPRKIFAEDALQELANSIAINGVIVPIIVKPLSNEKYEIIAGERRWRASIMAKKETIPAIIRDTNEFNRRLQALLENIQRDDLNPLEESEAYNSLINEYNLSHDKLAKQVGKSRATITNSLRLLNLPDEVKELVLENKISNGHAKALLGLANQDKILEIAYKIVDNKLTVRDTENLVSRVKNIEYKSDKISITDVLTNEKQQRQIEKQRLQIEDKLSKIYSTKAKLKINSNYSGTIKLEFYSLEDLERILELLQ